MATAEGLWFVGVERGVLVRNRSWLPECVPLDARVRVQVLPQRPRSSLVHPRLESHPQSVRMGPREASWVDLTPHRREVESNIDRTCSDAHSDFHQPFATGYIL